MLEVRLLGPLHVLRDGQDVALTAPKQRALVARLAVDVGHAVSLDRLIEDLWDGDPPPRADVSVRAYVSHVRRLVDASSDDDRSAIVTQGRGYSLQIGPDQLDTVRFERLVAQARRERSSDAKAAVVLLEDALDLWRGEPLADVAYHRFAQATVARLTELRLSAEEDRHELLLELGRHLEALPSIEAAAAEHALRERRQRHLMLALYRSGRAPDALEVHRRFRSLLADELGLDPSAALDALAGDILRQAPELTPSVHDAPIATAGDVAPTPPVATTAAAAEPLLIGREAEVRRLGSLVRRLPVGGVVLVVGEAGIGKTALLEAIAAVAAAEHRPAWWGRCHELSGTPALWPWIQIVRGTADEADETRLRGLVAGRVAPVLRLVPDVAERLGEAPGEGLADADAARFAMFEAISTYLARAAGASGAVVLLEDLHWADQDSLDLLAYLAAQAASVGLLLVVSLRDDAVANDDELAAVLATVSRERHAMTLELSGLATAAVAAVVRAAVGRDLGEDDVRSVVDRSGGNPFFVQQIALLLDALPPGPTPPIESLGIPPGVRHVLNRRLNALAALDREILEVAAVIGPAFDVPVLAAAAGRGVREALTALDTAVTHRLVTQDDRAPSTYRFVHALVRETIHGGLTPGRQARLHVAVLDALERERGVAVTRLAEHAWRAADLLEDGRPFRYARAAAEDAITRTAYDEAERHLRRALTLYDRRADDDPRYARLSTLLRLLHLRIAARGWETDITELTGSATELLAEVELRPGQLPIVWSLLTYHVSRGDIEIARALGDRFAEAARDMEDPVARCAAAAAQGHLATQRDDLEAAAQHFADARRYESEADAAVLAAVTAESLSVSLRISEVLFHVACEDGVATRALIDEALALAEATGRPFARAMVRFIGTLAGGLLRDPGLVADHAASARELADRHGFPGILRLVLLVEAWAAVKRGESAAEHRRAMEAALEEMVASRYLSMHGALRALLAEVELADGDRHAAERSIDQARVMLERTGEAVFTPLVETIAALVDAPT